MVVVDVVDVVVVVGGSVGAQEATTIAATATATEMTALDRRRLVVDKLIGCASPFGCTRHGGGSHTGAIGRTSPTGRGHGSELTGSAVLDGVG